MSRVIDLHAHVVPESCLDLERQSPHGIIGLRLEGRGASSVYWVDGTPRRGSANRPQAWTTGTATARLYDPAIRLREMAAMGVDTQVLSVPPFMYFYSLEARETLACAVLMNNGIAELCATYPDAFVGLATVPLNDPARAIEELDRALALPGMRGVEIGTHVAGRTLDDPALFSFFEAAAARGVPIFLHPHTPHAAYGWNTDRFDRYYLRNLVGNPLETSLGVAALVFGGVLERLPNLNVILPHAGGTVPYIRGRWEWGWRQIPDCQTIATSPGAALDRLFYDTISHYDPALEHLLRTVGPGQLVLGSDHPFDIGDPEPRSTIDRVVPKDQRSAVSGGNAARLLGIDGG